MSIFRYKCKKCGHIQESNVLPKQIHICERCRCVDIPLYSVDLYYVKSEFAVKILENELLRRDTDIKYESPEFYWTDNKGNKVEIRKIGSSHLRNIIGYIKKVSASKKEIL